jgi:arylsulfatase A
MPPYQKTPEETKKVVGKLGMEVAPDFIDNQCLTRFTDKAIAYIGEKAAAAKADKPFFLYLPYTSPHYPVCPLPEFHGQGDAGAYGEFVIETDYHVGRILAALKEAGIDDNTIVVYTCDNGPEKSWIERVKEFDHDSSGIYKDGKRSVYEGGHRVPFIIRWPAGIKQPGRSSNALVGQVDLMATFAEIVGAKLDDKAGVDSQSFASVLTKPAVPHNRAPLVNHGNQGRYSVTEANWKLVLPGGKFKAELYDLSKDPGEATNSIAEHPELAEQLQKKLTAIVCQGRTTPGLPQLNDTGHWKHLSWITPAEYNAKQGVREGVTPDAKPDAKQSAKQRAKKRAKRGRKDGK